MPQFRKKPVIVSAVQLIDGQTDFPAWFIQAVESGVVDTTSILPPAKIIIRTLEGPMNAKVGDWIIQGIAGEIYVCCSDVFNLTYEPA